MRAREVSRTKDVYRDVSQGSITGKYQGRCILTGKFNSTDELRVHDHINLRSQEGSPGQDGRVFWFKSALLPGQSFVAPACDGISMVCVVQRSFKSAGYYTEVRQAFRCQYFRSVAGSVATAADQQ